MKTRVRLLAIGVLMGVSTSTVACLPPPPWRAFDRHERVERRDRWERDHTYRDRWEGRDDRRERYEGRRGWDRR